MKFIVRTDLNEIEEKQDNNGLISQGATAGGCNLYLLNGDVMPSGCREATPEEIEQSHLYKARKKSLNTLRDGQIEAGADVEGLGIFDTDSTAQLRQTGALLLATLPIVRSMYSVVYKMADAAGDTEAIEDLTAARHEFQVPWVLKDNTTIQLGFDELKVIGPAVAGAVAEHVLAARGKKDDALNSLIDGSAFAAADEDAE